MWTKVSYCDNFLSKYMGPLVGGVRCYQSPISLVTTRLSTYYHYFGIKKYLLSTYLVGATI
jgi:hypothetical protein